MPGALERILPGLAAKRALVVADDQWLRFRLQRALQHAGCDVRFYAPQVELHILEPYLGLNLELLDFDHAWKLIEPAYKHSLRELRHRLV